MYFLIYQKIVSRYEVIRNHVFGKGKVIMQDVHSKEKYIACLDNVSRRLDVLHNVILTIQLGMKLTDLRQSRV